MFARTTFAVVSRRLNRFSTTSPQTGAAEGNVPHTPTPAAGTRTQHCSAAVELFLREPARAGSAQRWGNMVEAGGWLRSFDVAVLRGAGDGCVPGTWWVHALPVYLTMHAITDSFFYLDITCHLSQLCGRLTRHLILLRLVCHPSLIIS